MKKDIFSIWCQTATEKIKYSPDRQAVANELLAHLEDHRDTLVEQGMDEEAAIRETLSAMGSAEEIAPQLGNIHRPFWGYASSLTGAIAAIVLLCALIFTGISTANRTITREEPEYFTKSDLRYSTRIHYDRPFEVITGEGYLLLINKVAVWEPKYLVEGDTLSGYIQVKVFRLPHLDPFEAMSFFYATDGLGTHYQASASYWGIDEPRIDYANVAYLPLSQTFNLEISKIPTDGADWLELHYDRDGRDIAIRINLSGGDGT